MPTPETIFKVASQQVAAEAEATGVFSGMPVDHADGYIHFSTASQLPETLARHFCGQGGLVLLAVRTGDLGPELRWEPSRGGQLFPHLYGAFAMSAVAGKATIAVAADGSCVLPEWVR